MRIDVNLSHRDLEAELAVLHARMQRPADALHGLPSIATHLPDLVLRYREADGEFHVYVEDTAAGRLAGCTVFNRVFEVDRRAGCFVRSPHSRYAEAYHRRGVASAVYGWALAAGMCLVSGPRQSPGAHRLWLALARSHELAFVQVRDKRLHLLGSCGPSAFEDLDTRMLLLGAGWTLEAFVRATQCEVADVL
ncbi:N-acetyltransferase [Ramlibacter sp. USB13]|uniref:N-acetyltransferase n=1 Tax=Ramlibacter cellulosilyticus TaxID=2764187 RepID=A0A923SG54_9BURK|nr:N-acetyltransferase [Ramlibacter cellulosilyticus]MBC5784587.1 N-acetyltransferase [Ramlibacter cellulosilyticus]